MTEFERLTELTEEEQKAIALAEEREQEMYALADKAEENVEGIYRSILKKEIDSSLLYYEYLYACGIIVDFLNGEVPMHGVDDILVPIDSDYAPEDYVTKETLEFFANEFTEDLVYGLIWFIDEREYNPLKHTGCLMNEYADPSFED